MVHYIIIIIIGWCFTPLLIVFQSYHGDSSHYSCLSWVSPVLGWGSEVSCPKTLPRKTQRIQCGSNPGPLIYESNTLPLSHAGPVEWFSYVINVQYICCKEINSKDMTSLKSGNEDSNRFVRPPKHAFSSPSEYLKSCCRKEDTGTIIVSKNKDEMGLKKTTENEFICIFQFKG